MIGLVHGVRVYLPTGVSTLRNLSICGLNLANFLSVGRVRTDSPLGSNRYRGQWGVRVLRTACLTWISPPAELEFVHPDAFIRVSRTLSLGSNGCPLGVFSSRLSSEAFEIIVEQIDLQFLPAKNLNERAVYRPFLGQEIMPAPAWLKKSLGKPASLSPQYTGSRNVVQKRIVGLQKPMVSFLASTTLIGQ